MPLRRRLVSEETTVINSDGLIINSEVAQVVGRLLMLPLSILKEILKHLDTKQIIFTRTSSLDRTRVDRAWTGTQRMQNRASLRRRVGQTGWQSTQEIYANLDFVMPGSSFFAPFLGSYSSRNRARSFQPN